MAASRLTRQVGRLLDDTALFCVTGITVYDSDGLTLFTLKESVVPSESRCESSLSLSGCFGFLPGDISSYFQEPFRKSNL